MIVAVLLLGAAIIAVALFWGSWGLMAAAAAVALIQYATLRRSERFSSRVWRSAPVGRRRRRERGTETVYVVSALLGLVLFALAVVRLLA